MGVAGNGLRNILVRSFAAATARSAEEGNGMATLSNSGILNIKLILNN